MATAANRQIDPALDEIRRALARDPRVQQSKSTSLRVGKKVFAMVVGGKLVLKLPETTIALLVDAGAAVPWGMGGRVMKEWVQIEAKSRAKRVALAKQAMQFVSAR